jgi:hypothetical protein
VWKYQEGSWDSDLYVITEIVMAEAATVLISTGDSAVIELKAGGSVSSAGISLADLNAQFSVASTSGMGIEMVAKTGITPLFKAGRVRPGLFGTKWEVRRLEAPDEQEGDDAKLWHSFPLCL